MFITLWFRFSPQRSACYLSSFFSFELLRCYSFRLNVLLQFCTQLDTVC
uniref:Uncharacterized protein n=1 Tax=Arundo donax TaxID=35708 RepID=A0A0A8ZR28_ARUDO